MIILGIDPGTAKMGYGVVDASDNTTVLIKSDVIITHKDLDMHKRLMLLYKKLTEVAEEYNPHVMVIERLFFNTNVKTAMSVGQARGVSMLAAAHINIPVFEYTALQAKLILTGYGRSDKKEVQEAVKAQLNLSKKVKSDDANDAVAMALCFVNKDLKEFVEMRDTGRVKTAIFISEDSKSAGNKKKKAKKTDKSVKKVKPRYKKVSTIR